MVRPRLSEHERARGRELGRRLASYRGERELSAEAVARLSGVSIETIRSLERGRIFNPGVFTLMAVADALAVELTTLVESKATDEDGKS